MYREFPPVAFLAAFTLLLPLPGHWRARNVATLSIIVWLFISNLAFGIDAIVWADSLSVGPVAMVWCDITTKLMIGSNFSLPAACLCISMHLEKVASVRSTQVTASDKRRRQIFELIMCWGLPCVFMAVHYVVQGHRLDVIESFGCRPPTYYSIPSIFLMNVPPFLLSAASLVYGGLALRHFIRRRASFAAHLSGSNSALTPSRYIRLMFLSIVEMVWSLAVTAYMLYFTSINLPLRPWISWGNVHSDWNRVDTFPTVFIQQHTLTLFYLAWWLIPISTFLFVGVFAFGQEAVDDYKRCGAFVWEKLTFWRGPLASRATRGNIISGSRPSQRTGIELPIYDVKRQPSELTSIGASSPSTSKFKEALDSSYDEHSDAYSACTAGDLSVTPSQDIFTLPPLPSMSSDKALPSASPLSSKQTRPVTYPSFDPAHRALDPFPPV
ncbi:unnamed protein product [Mycena citricolor]|uniref:Uncharacterized protein n=1 Tax=Mycena citricolor TaxID=2018698 RepID=A0AAD2JZP2_9AGAR|nr:unnamed protein product [Mycena citricolor]